MASTSTRRSHRVVRLRGTQYTAKHLVEALDKVVADRFVVEYILDSGSAYTVVAARTVRTRAKKAEHG